MHRIVATLLIGRCLGNRPLRQSSLEDESDEEMETASPPESPMTNEVLDECGFVVPQVHQHLVLDLSSKERIQQRCVWNKHLKVCAPCCSTPGTYQSWLLTMLVPSY